MDTGVRQECARCDNVRSREQMSAGTVRHEPCTAGSHMGHAHVKQVWYPGGYKEISSILADQ
jgi:hypothetical protein